MTKLQKQRSAGKPTKRPRAAAQSTVKAAAKATAKRRKTGSAKAKPRKPAKKVLPIATTIGTNPLDTPVINAAVIAGIFGPAAGRKAEGKRPRRR